MAPPSVAPGESPDITVSCVDRLDKLSVNFFTGELTCLVFGCFVTCAGLDSVFFCLACSGDFGPDAVNVLPAGTPSITSSSSVSHEPSPLSVSPESVPLFSFPSVDFEGSWDLGTEFQKCIRHSLKSCALSNVQLLYNYK